MKNKKTGIVLSLLLAILLLVGACSSADVLVQDSEVVALSAGESYPALEGAVTEISRYGNIYIDLTSEELLSSYALGDIVNLEIGEYSLTAPVVTAYSDVDNGLPLVRADKEYLEIALSYADFATNYGVEVGDVFTITIAEAGGYLTQYNIRHLERSESREDYTDDAVFANFRAMSGGNLKENFLYRSCNPALDDARAVYADYLIESVGVKTVVNLSNSEETLLETMDPSSYYAELYEGGNVILLNMGVDYRQADFASRLKDGLEFIIANPEGPILVHCNEGKDRAGMVSALLEALAGASMDEIVSDYMLSYENYYWVERGSEQWNEIANIIRDFFTDINGRPFPESGVKTVAEVYLTGTVGLTEAQVAELEAIITK